MGTCWRCGGELGRRSIDIEVSVTEYDEDGIGEASIDLDPSEQPAHPYVAFHPECWLKARSHFEAFIRAQFHM